MRKKNKKFILKPKKSIQNVNLSRPRLIDGFERDKKKYWLDKNENFDPILNSYLVKIFNKINSKFISSYPDSGFLHQKLSDHLKLKSNNIIFSYGSDGVIKSVFETFLNINDMVFHTNPTFAMYPIYSKIYAVKTIQINYKKNQITKKPYIDFNELLKLIDKYRPKLFCLPNPDSPTGTVLSNLQIRKILNHCLHTNTLVLIDEAYYPYYPNTNIDLIKKFENLIVARTFSKAWGLAGLRIGYAAAHSNIIKYLNKSKPMYEVGNYQLHFINLAINKYNQVLKSVERSNKSKLFFNEEMKKLNFTVLDTYANFTHVNFGEKKHKILKNLSNKFLFKDNFEHNSLKGFTRFTIGTEAVMKKLVLNIKKLSKNNE